MELHIGDVTFMSRFNKVAFTDADEQFTFGFHPNRGKKFVVLLLGEVDKKATDSPAEAMLNELGFFRRALPADNVLNMLGEDDMYWLRRFRDFRENDEDEHDLPETAILSLEALGALRSIGYEQHELTKFGAHLLGKESV